MSSESYIKAIHPPNLNYCESLEDVLPCVETVEGDLVFDGSSGDILSISSEAKSMLEYDKLMQERRDHKIGLFDLFFVDEADRENLRRNQREAPSVKPLRWNAEYEIKHLSLEQNSGSSGIILHMNALVFGTKVRPDILEIFSRRRVFIFPQLFCAHPFLMGFICLQELMSFFHFLPGSDDVRASDTVRMLSSLQAQPEW
jgi:hypothetical protein